MGQSHVKSSFAKVQAINDFPVPSSKNQLMRFLGMTGYYRNSVIMFLLCQLHYLIFYGKIVNLCGIKLVKIPIKAMFKNAPALLAPIFVNYFNLLLMLVMLVQGRGYFYKKMKMVLIILFVIFHINLTPESIFHN